VFLQRLFTTFADGWPGLGLLVQRLITGIALLHGEIALSKETPATLTMLPEAIGAVLAIFIMIGLWTPATGALIAVTEMWILFAHPNSAEMAMLLAMLGGTLAMIGPGAFSIDAQLFGRKRIHS
jgi:putative oxidoreductase